MESLSPDTQATLLLVGRFTASKSPRPLTNAQYRHVAEALHALKLRPADLLNEVPSNLGVERDRIVELLNRGTALALALERWGQLGIRVIGRSDRDYPKRLRSKLKGKAAPVLFAAGDVSLLESDSICIVGSRNASKQGLAFSENLGVRCAKEQVAVVSGDAKGVDRAAMNGALNHNGVVIGVLSDSLGKAVLTKSNREAILDGRLVLVSPYSPETHFTIAQAMDRNKYLYVMSVGAIIVESDVKGGTWSGALENARHGWVPALVRGGKNSPAGNQELIARGVMPIVSLPEFGSTTLANLIANSSSYIAEFKSDITLNNNARVKIDDKVFSVFNECVCSWLEKSPQKTEAIAARFDMSLPQVMKWLSRIYAAGSIEQLDACHWSIKKTNDNHSQSTLPL